MQQGLGMAGFIGYIVVDFSTEIKEEPGGSLVLLLLSSNIHT